MSAYIIMDVEVNDSGRYEEYKNIAPAAVAAYGGRYLARGGKTEILEGYWEPKRLVILEFDSIAQAKAWLNSPEYSPARRLRHQASRSNMVVIEGVE